MSEEATLAEVAKALNARHPAGARLPALWFMTDEARTPDVLGAIQRLPKGCGIVFRHYNALNRHDLAAKVVETAHAAGRPVLIAADAALATRLGADGVHLPEHLSDQIGAIRAAWPGALITFAAHSAEALESPRGADAAFLSPVFPTESHPRADHLGTDEFTRLVRAAQLPVYALGGITKKTAPQLLGSGAVGLAAIGGLAEET